MNHVYLLQSNKDRGFYIGFTTRDPSKRFLEHQHGLVGSTKNRRPMTLLYYEAYLEEESARTRETSLKQFGSAYTGLLKRLCVKK